MPFLHPKILYIAYSDSYRIMFVIYHIGYISIVLANFVLVIVYSLFKDKVMSVDHEPGYWRIFSVVSGKPVMISCSVLDTYDSLKNTRSLLGLLMSDCKVLLA